MDGELGLVDSGVGDCFILLSFFPFFHRLLTYEEKKKKNNTIWAPVAASCDIV